jgi:hypothetical protein
MDLSPILTKLIPRINGVWNFYSQLYEGKKNKLLDETLDQVSNEHNIDKSDLKSFLETFDNDELNQNELKSGSFS